MNIWRNVFRLQSVIPSLLSTRRCWHLMTVCSPVLLNRTRRSQTGGGFFRQKARDAFTELTVAIVSANGLAGRLKLDEAMRSALQRLDALADTPERSSMVGS